jgi:6-phosphogluconolactonase
MSVVNFNKFQNKDTLASALSNEICNLLALSLKQGGRASLILSGGNTPKKLFEKLSLCDINWNKVIVSLCDERWVDTQNIDSNEYLIKTSFLKNYARNANFIGMYEKDKTLKQASIDYENRIKQELLPFDIVILGMGTDGHMASLFPNNEKFEQAFGLNNKFCLDVTQKTPKYQRLSLTNRAILKAKHIFLHFEGKEKLRIYNLALKTNDINKYPISSIINQKIKNIEVYFA